VGHPVLRIDLRPHRVDVEHLAQFPGYCQVVAVEISYRSCSGTGRAWRTRGQSLFGLFRPSHGQTRHPEIAPCDGEVWIDLDGPFEKRQRGGFVGPVAFRYGHAVQLECLQRSGGRLPDRTSYF